MFYSMNLYSTGRIHRTLSVGLTAHIQPFSVHCMESLVRQHGRPQIGLYIFNGESTLAGIRIR